jgi:hypothetical protein
VTTGTGFSGGIGSRACPDRQKSRRKQFFYAFVGQTMALSYELSGWRIEKACTTESTSWTDWKWLNIMSTGCGDDTDVTNGAGFPVRAEFQVYL